MAVNNVFQMLAQQEIDKPQRRLQDLQIRQQEMQMKKLQDEQAYQDRFKASMSAPQQAPAMSLSALGNPMTQSVPNSPMGPQEIKPPSIVDQFKRQYDFHVQNGRADLAQQVMEHQVDLSSKAAKVAEHAYKTGGKEGLAAWLQANPTFAPLLGDPAHMKLEKEGVLFPASDEKGQPVPGMFWYRGADGSVQWKEIKPDAGKETWGEPYSMTVGGKKAMVQKSSLGQIRPVVQDTSTTVKVNAGGDKTDAIVAREAVKDLPKLRREARTAEASKPRIAQMVKLIDSGAGGLKGNALAAVSGVFDTPATSEAELFKKLAAAGAGQLRTAVIGPGAVSNYEQSLLQSISGGGNGARTAIRQLLKFYEQEADRTILNYNDAVDSAATVAPKVVKGFGKVGGGKSGGKKDPLGILD